MAGTRGVRFGVGIEGDLGGFMRQLRASPERLDLQIRARYREIAGEVRDEARGVAESRRPGGGASTGRVRAGPQQHWKDLVNSVRSGSTSRAPHVAIGTARVPWAVGHEWGSKGRYRQFPPATQAGYILWSTAKRREGQIVDRMGDAVGEVLGEAYPEQG